MFSASARFSKGQGYQGFFHLSLGKGQGAVLAKKWQVASYLKEKLEKPTEFHYF
jgi:hypothetical protein